jgi:hypothetical protein
MVDPPLVDCPEAALGHHDRSQEEIREVQRPAARSDFQVGPG